MIKFYHMSPSQLSVGTRIGGNGKDKVDHRIEDALESAKPGDALSRRDAVFMLDVPDFSRCGLLTDCFVYHVEPEGDLRKYDLNWLRRMQQALFRQKHGGSFFTGLARYGEWNDELVLKCCAAYWAQQQSAAPVWEYLAPQMVVRERLTDLIAPASTSGWTKRSLVN